MKLGAVANLHTFAGLHKIHSLFELLGGRHLPELPQSLILKMKTKREGARAVPLRVARMGAAQMDFLGGRHEGELNLAQFMVS